jgi:hypothetical protein
MGRRLRQALVLTLLASGGLGCLSPLRAQGIAGRIPARGAQFGGVGPGLGETIIVSGVPGELSVIRLKPRPPFLSVGWELMLLQAGEPTRILIGGPHETLVADPVQFGLDGAVAAVVRPLGAVGGHYVLRASSQLPLGYAYPPVVPTLVPPPGFNPYTDPDYTLNVATWMRRGLELRVKLHFGPNGDGTSGLYVEFSPQVEVTPPAMAGAPWIEALDHPYWPFPHTWVNTFEPSGFAHVEYEIEQFYFKSLSAHLVRKHVVEGKDPGDMPAPEYVTNVMASAVEVPVGAHIVVTALMLKPPCIDPTVTKTARVWLASPHAVWLQAQAGIDLTGPITVELGAEPTQFAAAIDLPPQIGPGLYELQLQVGTPDVVGSCADSLLKLPAALPLRVLGP